MSIHFRYELGPPVLSCAGSITKRVEPRIQTGRVTSRHSSTPLRNPLSSLQEPQTVIEIRSEGTSEEILSVGNDYDDDEMDRIDDEDSFPRGNGSRSDRGGSESSESSSVLSGLQDMENAVKYGSGIERLQMGAFLPLDIRKSEEPHLSTVSEVSEESSKNGMIRVRKKKSDRKTSEASSISEEHPSRFSTPKGALASKRSSSSEYIPSETTTPDSTTSGSFVLDNGSYTENGSYNSLSNHDAKTADSCSQAIGDELREKDDSKTRTESESVSESFKDSKSSKTPLPPDEDSLGRRKFVSDSMLTCTAIRPSAATASASPPPPRPQRHQRPLREAGVVDAVLLVLRQPPEGCRRLLGKEPLPQPSSVRLVQRGGHPQAQAPRGGRRKKDRLRNRSEPREHVTSLQFSRAERSKSRSKSRSPEKKLSDDETPWFRGRGPAQPCSRCGSHQTPVRPLPTGTEAIHDSGKGHLLISRP
ncbi:hypothetical protein CEXT_244151 [Caerostris extrusa]|uniref:Uncharacterized protein n=1 Tax=Caerostris extrusa TaxID=172846 RepID=A0AAV4PTH6_CAEEX|nr:hypothetical protein CEXT_244151 [Caerostris extrusa]